MLIFAYFQGVKIVFKVGLALLKYCHDDLVSTPRPLLNRITSTFPAPDDYLCCIQIKLPFEKLIHALRNFPEDAMNPDILLPMAYSFKVLSLSCCSLCVKKIICFFFTRILAFCG